MRLLIDEIYCMYVDFFSKEVLGFADFKTERKLGDVLQHEDWYGDYHPYYCVEIQMINGGKQHITYLVRCGTPQYSQYIDKLIHDRQVKYWLDS